MNVRSFYKKIKGAFFNNRIWYFITRQGKLTTAWENSITFDLLERTANYPVNVIKCWFDRYPHIIKGSFFVEFVSIFAKRFEIIMAIIIAVMVIVPHRYWSNGYSVVFSLLIFGLYVIKTVLYREKTFNMKTIDAMLFIFMSILFISAITSIFPYESILCLKYFIPGFILLIVTVNSLKTRKQLEIFIMIILIGISISAVYGIVQAIGGIPVDPSLTDIEVNENMPGRVFSTMGNPNNYAELLILALPFFFGTILNTKKILTKILFCFPAVITLVALGITYSRSGYIAFAAATVVFVFFKNKTLTIILIISGLASIPLLPSSIHNRILTILSGDSSVNFRISVLKSSVSILKDFWFSGLGLGAKPFAAVSPDYYIPGLSRYFPHSHNLFLEIWIETGLIGIISFMWFTGRVLKRTILHIYRQSDIRMKNILAAGTSSMAGILVFALAEYVWFYPRLLLFYWIITGIIISGLSISNRYHSDVDEYGN